MLIILNEAIEVYTIWAHQQVYVILPSCISCADNDNITLTKNKSASISIIDPLPNANNGALIISRSNVHSSSYYYSVVHLIRIRFRRIFVYSEHLLWSHH